MVEVRYGIPTRITLTVEALDQTDWPIWAHVCDLIETMFKHPDRIEINSLRIV
jgi:hypothetical protein